MRLLRTVKACVVAGLAVGLVAVGVAVPAIAQSGVDAEVCRQAHSSPAGDFVTTPGDTDGDGVAETCVLANYFGSEPGVGLALKRLRDAHAVEYQCHLSAVLAGQSSNCETSPASPVLQGQEQGPVELNQQAAGVSAEVCRQAHSSPAGDFVTTPGDTDGDGIAETCVLANYFGSEPGVGLALKRLRDAHITEYQCHLSAVLAGQPSNCETQTVKQDEVPLANSVLSGFQRGRWLIDNHPEVAASLAELPWVRDGLTRNESDTIYWILNEDVEFIELLSSFTWLSDGMTDDGLDLLQELAHLNANVNDQTVRNIVQAPFLVSVEAHDVLAVLALQRLSSRDRSEVDSILEKLEDNGGFTDYWARIVPVVPRTQAYDPELADRLLDPASVQIETQTVQLPHSGQTELAIIRTDTSRPSGTSASMNHLRHALATVERYVGGSLRNNYVVIVYADALASGVGAANSGTHITLPPYLDVRLSMYPISGAPNPGYEVIPHEVVHYYFDAGTFWISEGVAEFLAQLSENKRIGAQIAVRSRVCRGITTLEELDRLAFENWPGGTFWCNYPLGEGLFVELYQTLGDQAFREGLQDLLPIYNADHHAGLRAVRTAFGAEAGNAADRIINRWYYGT